MDMKGTKENYTHIKFFYKYGGVLTINKYAHINLYANEKAEYIQYIICN